MSKSPFVIIEEFISPLMCEDIINRLDHTFPNYNIENKPIKTVKANRLSEIRVLKSFQECLPEIEAYYGIEYGGMLPFEFEWFVPNCVPEKLRCENSIFERGLWKRINDYDFTGIVFLNDYQDKPPFDDLYEVVGGGLEFPNHDFTVNPKRGTLVLFPSCEYFLNHTNNVALGELNQIRFHFACSKQYNYNPKQFPGSHEEWFI